MYLKHDISDNTNHPYWSEIQADASKDRECDLNGLDRSNMSPASIKFVVMMALMSVRYRL